MTRPRRRADGPDGGPRSVHEALEALADRLGVTGVASFGAVFTRWDEIAGGALSAHVRPLRLRSGVLVVTVDHPAWATQVKMLSATLLDRVAEVGGARPERLEIVVRDAPRRPPTPPEIASEGGPIG